MERNGSPKPQFVQEWFSATVESKYFSQANNGIDAKFRGERPSENNFFNAVVDVECFSKDSGDVELRIDSQTTPILKTYNCFPENLLYGCMKNV